MSEKTFNKISMESSESYQMLIDFIKEACYGRKWLRTTEIAEYLGISLSQVHNLKNEGVLPYTKLAGTIFFNKEEIDSILKQNQEKTVL